VSKAYEAVATVHHAYFTGLTLMIASRKGAKDVGQWAFNVFRSQHMEKFKSSFDKLGLSDLPDAVAAARYHYLSNKIGGVEVEYMEESDQKAWIRFCHPRWMYEGTALCGIPIEVSHGFIRGWYAHNGVSLNNKRLGFVCTSQDMTADYGFAGYFKEYDHDLEADKRLVFAPGERPPAFDPDKAPWVDTSTWPEERLAKARRNYAMEYIKTGLNELVKQFGRGEAMALGGLAAEIIGRQYYRRLQEEVGADRDDNSLMAFARFMEAMAGGMDDGFEIERKDGEIILKQTGWRLMRGVENLSTTPFDCWNGLWRGCLSVHDRDAQLELLRRQDFGDAANEWRLRKIA